jgi:hypothetical protein
MGEMVGDQTANQAANPLKKGKKEKKKSPLLEQENCSLSCSDVNSFSIQTYLCVS